MSQLDNVTDGPRQRRPNVTIDQDAVKAEKIQKLKSSRSGIKASLSRIENEILI